MNNPTAHPMQTTEPESPTPSLVDYVEREIIPRYGHFDRAHGTDHVRTVIVRSLALAAHYTVDLDMVYAIAAYHDTGLVAGRERHHLVSAEILAADRNLARWFSAEQMAMMCDAVEDHRASAKRPPRSLYGRLVAAADRPIAAATILRRPIQYGLDHYPALDREGHRARCMEHLRDKYGDGGYLQLWFAESENAPRLEELRALIRATPQLARLFARLFAEESAVQPISRRG